jgi:dTDP-glucose 4,6-dehydratase
MKKARTNWAMRRVLVTGAGGFIGSHLTERLVELGATTRALIHYNSRGHRGWLEHSARRRDIEFLPGDIRDLESVRRAMDDVDVVFHLAALIAIPYSYQAPASYVETNINGTLNVLQAAREHGTRRVVHTSTSEVYGSALEVPIRESHPLQGQSPYSATKIGADKMAEAFHRSFGVPVVTVRPFNTFGPRQSARAVVPTIITQGLAGKAVRLGSLSPTRDLNFVSNIVDGFVLAAEKNAAIGETLNLGSAREISIGDLAALIGRLLGRKLNVKAEAQRIRPAKSEVERLLADHTKAGQILGWQPKVSLEAGLERTIAWLKENRDAYEPTEYAI